MPKLAHRRSTRFEAMSDAVVERHSKGWPLVEAAQKGTRQMGLEMQRWLETLGLDRYNPVRRCDEEVVMLEQDLAVEVSEYGALDRPSSCCAHHDLPHRTEHQTEENKQNELSTDLSRL